MARNPKDDDEDTQKIELGLIVPPPSRSSGDKTLTDFERPEGAAESEREKKTPTLVRQMLWPAVVCIVVALAWHFFISKYGDRIQEGFDELRQWYLPKGMR